MELRRKVKDRGPPTKAKLMPRLDLSSIDLTSESNAVIYIYVYVCYHCGKEFTCKDSLQTHTTSCSAVTQLESVYHDIVSETASIPPTNYDALPGQEKGSDMIASSALDIQPVEGTTLLPPTNPCPSTIRVSKPKFLSSIGLLPLQKARRVSERRQSTQCENLDLNEEVPASPAKPRTPKLLISHLSREDSTSAAEPGSACKRSLFPIDVAQNTKKESSEEGNETSMPEAFPTTQDAKSPERLKIVKSLFTIPITSLLGQVVLKHYKGDPSLYILTDIESHCLTEMKEKSENGFCLRKRNPVYPVTFRGYVRNGDWPYLHKYNFNREDRKEFLRRVKTGLDQRSRSLLRKMRKCKVHLTRITEAQLKLWMASQNRITIDLKPLTATEIKFWTGPKQEQSVNLPAIFPDGLNFSSPNLDKILGIYTRNSTHHQLLVSSFVSEDVSAEVSQNRRAVLRSILCDTLATQIEAHVAKEEKPHGSKSFSVLRHLLSCPTTGLDRGPSSGKSMRVGLNKLDSEHNSIDACIMGVKLSESRGTDIKPGIPNKGTDIKPEIPNIGTDINPGIPNKGKFVPNREELLMGTSSQKQLTAVRDAREGCPIVVEPRVNLLILSSNIETEDEKSVLDIQKTQTGKCASGSLVSQNSAWESSSQLGTCASSSSLWERLRSRSRRGLEHKNFVTKTSSVGPMIRRSESDSNLVEERGDNEVFMEMDGIKSSALPAPKRSISMNVTLKKEIISNVDNLKAPVNGVHSSPRSILFPNRSSVCEPKLKKRLLKAGLVWRCQNLPDWKKDQENKSKNGIVPIKSPTKASTAKSSKESKTKSASATVKWTIGQDVSCRAKAISNHSRLRTRASSLSLSHLVGDKNISSKSSAVKLSTDCKLPLRNEKGQFVKVISVKTDHER